VSTSEWNGIAGRVAVVTGGSRGIGAATARRLAELGARVAVLDLDPHEAEEGGSAEITLGCDITSRDSVTEAFAHVATRLGDVGILVNNAGINAHHDPVTMTDPEWDTVFATDLRGAWLCSQQVLPGMSGAGGAIVNISSIHARSTLEGFFPYAAAKAGLEGLTRSLALEVGPQGIRVNVVAPGYTNTRLVADWIRQEAARGGPDADSLASQHALRRIAEPAEVAAAVCFLASDAASAITGTTLTVDCGLSARLA
jgi:NAD(P)-dependent dehydrogenase (short-subunit alcohol dehydrogenase family)